MWTRNKNIHFLYAEDGSYEFVLFICYPDELTGDIVLVNYLKNTYHSLIL